MQSVKRLMQVVGLAAGLVCAGGALAQSADEAAPAATQGASQEKAQDKKKGQAQPERAFISTGMDEASVAQMRPEQTVWLEAGPGGQTLGLLERADETPAKGGIVILADEGQTADSALAGALRQPLAAAGWGTMSLGLHEPPYALLKARSEGVGRPSQPDNPDGAEAKNAAASGSDPASAAAPADSGSIMIDVMARKDLDQLRKDYQDDLKGQLNAAIGKMRGLGYERVVLIGVGRGAGPVARQALLGSGAGDAEPQLLVWVAPTLEPTDLEAVAQSDASSLRILDLRSQQAADDLVSDQKAALRRAGFKGYQQQQVAMDRRPMESEAAPVASRVSAWLERTLHPEVDQ